MRALFARLSYAYICDKNSSYYIVVLMFVLVKEDTDRASPILKMIVL